MRKRRLAVLVSVVLLSLVGFAPIALYPSATTNQAEIERLKPDYWKVAAEVAQLDNSTAFQGTPQYERAVREQIALRQKLHLLGHHIDDDEAPCEWSGYAGAWRLLLARLGLA